MIKSLLLSPILLGCTFAQPTRLLDHAVLTLQATSPVTSYPREDLKLQQGCKPITLLSAYGEENENIGHAFFKAMVKMLHGTDNIDFQELSYRGDGSVYDDEAEASSGGQFRGSKIMARMAAEIMDDCPSTLLVLSSSGRGSRVVHDAAAEMDPSLLDSVTAVVVFGPSSLATGIREPQVANSNLGCRKDSRTCATSQFMAKTRLVSPFRPHLAASFVVDRISGRA